MTERDSYAPTWWLRREAVRLGVPFDRLQRACDTYQLLERRILAKDRCEWCGAVLRNYHLDPETVRESGGSDEDGNEYCRECADGLRSIDSRGTAAEGE